MSRPVTIEELRLWADTFDGAMRNCVVEQGDTRRLHQIVTDAAWAAHNALAALPAEQEPKLLRHGPEHGCAQWQDGSPVGSASYVAPSAPQHDKPLTVHGPLDFPAIQHNAEVPQDSAVPELPDLEDDGFRTATSVGAYTLVATAKEYSSLRTAAEALRKRLVEALRERNGLLLRAQQAEYGEQEAIAAADRSARLRREAEAERDEAQRREREKRDREEDLLRCLEQMEAERDEARASDAESVALYRRNRERLEAERDALRSQLDQAQRQEPVAWVLALRDYGAMWALPEREGKFSIPLYAAPVPAADTAQQIAAAEQRGRAQAFEEVASECERRSGGCWTNHLADVARRGIAEWCRTKAEEARG